VQTPVDTTAGRRPRLLVLNQYYGPGESTGQLLREMSEDLTDQFDVTVLAARPGDEETRSMPAAGVEIHWVPATSFGKRSLALRLLNYLTFLVAAVPVGLRVARPDVVLCMTNPPFVGLLGVLLSRLRRARLVITVQDVHPDVGVISGRLTSKPAVWALGAVQRFLMRRADRIVAISDAMRTRLIERGAAADRFAVIGNWIDADEIAPQPRDNEWARREGLNGRFTVMHAGNVGLLQDIETFVDAAALAPEVTFVVVGEGANKKALIERAAAQGLENVIFLPRQPRDELGLLLASADAHVVSLMPGLAGLMEPSKLYGILAAARPVLAGMEPGTEAAQVVERGRCGIRSDLAALDGTERAEMGQRGREWCEQHCTRVGATAAYRELFAELA
jgi:colanic acid biosynthesis glycosyl transferase WcaI